MSAIFYKDILYAGGGGGNACGGTTAPNSSIGSDGDYYYLYDSSGDVQIIYVKLSGAWHKIIGGDIVIGNMETINYSNALQIGHTGAISDIYAIGTDVIERR